LRVSKDQVIYRRQEDLETVESFSKQYNGNIDVCKGKSVYLNTGFEVVM
jgi:hypothetical protein